MNRTTPQRRARRLAVVAAGTVATALVLAGCGSAGSTESSATEDDKAAAVDENGIIEAGISYALSGSFDPMIASGAVTVARLSAESAAHVALVEMHTAPRGTASEDALARSLDELTTWDWSGARLVIEHCDSPVAGQEFEKGFLSVADELSAIAGRSDVGMWLNWGRSAVELRDADAVTAQIAEVAASGSLVGLGFSGAAGVAGPYGAAWADAHLPILSTHPESGSILDDEHVAAALQAAGAVPYLGVKTSRRPTDLTAADVVHTVAANLAVVRAAS